MDKRGTGGNMFLNFLSPFRNRQYDLNQVTSPKLQDHLKCLDSAYSRTLEHKETPITRTLIYKRPITNVELTPSHYPSKPMRNMNYLQYFMNLDASTLFFICYYFNGSRAQYLAAEVLKAQSWMYNTKCCKWLKRSNLPNVVMKNFEIGSYYYYYDWENMMISRWLTVQTQHNELEDDD